MFERNTMESFDIAWFPLYIYRCLIILVNQNADTQVLSGSAFNY